MVSGANMTPKPIQVRSEHPLTKPSPDWFDDNHDSLLILLSRDCEENGLSPQPEASRFAA